MSVDMPPEPPAFREEAEPRYPFTGFLFSGEQAALSKLEERARSKGIDLEKTDLGGGVQGLRLPPDKAFEPPVVELINEVQRGAFGTVRLGIISESR